MRGKIYGIGVGPGDPELMTLKACRLIRSCDVIAVPGSVPQEALSYRIALAALPEMALKECMAVDMPMVYDKEARARSHRTAADCLEKILDTGKTIAYLTLGDVSVYCTFSYLLPFLEADGYETELVSGIPSFCDAAARLHLPLAEGEEALHIIPGAVFEEKAAALPGTCVIMKSGRQTGRVMSMLRESGRAISLAENCGMAQEKLYHSAAEIPDEAGYFSLIIAKENTETGF